MAPDDFAEFEKSMNDHVLTLKKNADSKIESREVAVKRKEELLTKKAMRFIEKKKRKLLQRQERKNEQREKNKTTEPTFDATHTPSHAIQSGIELPKMNDVRQFASIDLGIDVLAAVYTPIENARPLLINGGEITRANLIARYHLACLSSKYGKYVHQHYKVLHRREKLISNYLHTASSTVIKYLEQFHIKQVVIGYNIGWKTGVNMGAATNDKFYKIPYRKFIDMLFYKGQDVGIAVIENEEAYTSKCDSLTDETVGFHHDYTGIRTNRGLFVSGVGIAIHADINGAINILRKWINKTYSTMTGDLKEVIARTHKMILSPLKSGILLRTASIKGGSFLSRCVVRRGSEYLVG